jgi:hypothetical protein
MVRKPRQTNAGIGGRASHPGRRRETGDVLLIDSHLVHRWTANHSHGSRAAMAYHYSAAG